MTKKLLLGTLSIAFFAMMQSCKVIKPYERPQVKTEWEEKLFRATGEQTEQDSSSIGALGWREVFTDPQLQALIEEGLQNNYNIKNAILQIEQAQATFTQTKGAFFPNVNFAPNITNSQNSKAALNFPAGINIKLNTTTYQLPIMASWEIDVWGKLKSTRKMQLANLMKAQATKQAVEAEVISGIANYYYVLAALDKQLEITKQTLEIRNKSLETMQALQETGRVNGAIVVQSQANLYAVEVSIPDIEKRIREVENALTILLGRPADSVNRGVIESQVAAMENIKISAGVPLQLLRNRPDIQAAEFAFQASFEQTNYTRTLFYPNLTLSTANIGFSALTKNSLFEKSLFYTITAMITQPIFNRGNLKMQLANAKVSQNISLNTFYATLLKAGQEVSDALFAYDTAKRKAEIRAKQITTLEQAVEYTRELLTYTSTTTYSDVLTSEQALLGAQLELINDQLVQLQSIVTLYKALGGTNR